MSEAGFFGIMHYCCGKRSSLGGTEVHTLCGAGPSGRGRGSGGSELRGRTAAVWVGLRRGSGAEPEIAGTALSATSSSVGSLSGVVASAAAAGELAAGTGSADGDGGGIIGSQRSAIALEAAPVSACACA